MFKILLEILDSECVWKGSGRLGDVLVHMFTSRGSGLPGIAVLPGGAVRESTRKFGDLVFAARARAPMSWTRTAGRAGDDWRRGLGPMAILVKTFKRFQLVSCRMM